MKTKKCTYQKPAFHKALMGVVAALCLILSSCVIKSQLKAFLGEQPVPALSTKTAKESKKSVNSFQSNTCIIDAPSGLWSADMQSIQAQLGGFSGAFTLFVISAFFVLLIGGAIKALDTHQRFYLDRNFRLAALPLFLSHRRLLI